MVYYTLTNIFELNFGIKNEEFNNKDLLNRIRKNKDYINILKKISDDSKCMLLHRFKKELSEEELYYIYDNYNTEEFWKFYNNVCNK
jgi:hypothetical protein